MKPSFFWTFAELVMEYLWTVHGLFIHISSRLEFYIDTDLRQSIFSPHIQVKPRQKNNLHLNMYNTVAKR